jgi:hypothetical protein
MLVHEEFQFVIQNLLISDPIHHFSSIQKTPGPFIPSNETTPETSSDSPSAAITFSGFFTVFFVNLLSKQSEPLFLLCLQSSLPVKKKELLL